MSATTSPRPSSARPSASLHRKSTTSTALSRRARELRDSEIAFVPNAGFEKASRTENKMVTETLQAGENDAAAPNGWPAHIHQISRTELMSQEQEQAMFREMNLLKFRANRLRSQIDLDQPDQSMIDEIDQLMARSVEIRNHIIQSNVRLVISIVKKFASPQQSFDDLLGDGTITLMNAVEKFDFSRGFRFSTYAYRSIVRSSYRNVVATREEKICFVGDSAEQSFEQEEDRSSSTLNDKAWSELRALASQLLHRLDRRERFIIRSRYALGSHRRVRTFQCLADKLGVSKERARQIERRAVGKLQKMAGEIDLEALLGAAQLS